MPRWDFECSQCGKKEIDVTHYRCDPEPVWPSCCGQRMEMLFGGFNQSVTFFEPFTTTNLHHEGKELHVRTQKELSHLQNEMGVQRVDDPDIKADGGRFVRDTSVKQQVFDCGRRSSR